MRQVIGAAFLRVIGQVEYRKSRGGTIIGALLTIGIEFFNIDLTHIMVRQLFQVALDVARRQCRTATGEDGIDIIPCQQGTVVTTRHTFPVSRLYKQRRHTRQCPGLRIAHVNIVLRILEIIDIRGIVLRATGRPRYQLGKLTREGDMRGLFHMEERYLIEHRRKPLRLLFPVNVQSPQRVAQGLCSHRHLRGKSLLGEVHQRTTQLEILTEVVLPVEANHRLALHAVVGIRLQRYIDIGSSIDDALVQDRHLTRRIIHRVVAALSQYHTTSRDDHGARRHIISAQGDHICRGALILTCHNELILLGNLLGGRLRGIVELGEHVFLGCLGIHTCCPQLLTEVTTKRLCRRKEHTTITHRIALYIVEIAIRVTAVVIVKTVAPQQFEQRAVFHLRFRNIRQIDACRIALVFDVETELGLFHR